jgi:HSP20 family molecular chaperone IbpA
VKVSEQEKALLSQTKRLNQQRRHVIKTNEADLARLKNHYQEKNEDEKVRGEKLLINTKHRYQEGLAQAAEAKAKKLEEYRTHLQDYRKSLDNERDVLQGSHKAKMGDINRHQNEKIESFTRDANQRILAINDQSNYKVKDSEAKSSQMIQDLRSNLQAKYNAAEQAGESKLRQSEEDFSRLQHQRNIELSKAITKEETMHQNLINDVKMKQSRELDDRMKAFMAESNFQEKLHLQRMDQSKKSFKQKYDNLVKGQQKAINDLKAKITARMNKLIEDFGRDKSVVVEKSADPFYTVDKLGPKIKDAGKFVLVSLSIPVHEKESVILSSDGRMVNLSLTRQFDQKLTAKDGSLNETKRSEVFTKQFQVPDILDPGKITQSYQDGVLTFKIAKA